MSYPMYKKSKMVWNGNELTFEHCKNVGVGVNKFYETIL